MQMVIKDSYLAVAEQRVARAPLILIAVESGEKKSAMLPTLPVSLFSKQKSTQNINGKNYNGKHGVTH